ncbi:MAG: glycosyltransferase [Rhodobacteraceae bacterium]|nr:glycosyltransferase [Paracoccaceae bacterium]
MTDPACPLTVAIMSYNRPEYLRNCLESVRRHLPQARVLVMDDASDDPRQLDALRHAQADAAVRVVIGGAGSDWHGGLYGNMQRALDLCETPLLLYLQDDSQIVRDVNPDEIAALLDHLTRTGAAFLYPFFLKAKKKRAWARRFVPDAAHRLMRPVRGADGVAQLTYADIALAHVPVLRRADWHFQRSEPANETQAAARFPEGMAILADPWGFYCPEVPVFRHRERTRSWVHRLTTRGDGGANRLRPLDAATLARLRGRTPPDLPIAEDWVTAESPRIKTPFVFDEMKRNKLIWLAFVLEQRVRRRR